MNTTLALIGADLVAVSIVTFALYFRRHQRRDLVVAFLGVNIGVLAVSVVLGTSEVALGLGLGLFGVLSIIRLRSSEISQREVAYYFSVLAIGLISGLPHGGLLLPFGLIALIVMVMYIADHPGLLPRSGSQVVRLDRAIPDESELRGELERRLGVEITGVSVKEVNFVNETTLVEATYRTSRVPVATDVPRGLRAAA